MNVPILAAPRGSRAARLAAAFSRTRIHPVAVFLVVMLAGLIVIATVSIACGFLVTRVLERIPGLGSADEHVNVWLAAHRTPFRTHVSVVGSIIGGGVVLPLIAGAVAIACVLVRQWRIAAFVVFALAVESATYRVTTLAVHSHRPRVARLETLDPNASYPSGHTAAALALYGALALLLTSRFRDRIVRVIAWTAVLALDAFVATARMYRGMHHPFDVAGGVVVGVAALLVVLFACRTAGAVADARSAR